MKKIEENEFPIVAIVAVSKDFIIGDGKKMLWYLPNDLKRLKSLTLGNPLIMGRKTFDSIGKPLSGRANIVLTKQRNQKDEVQIAPHEVILSDMIFECLGLIELRFEHLAIFAANKTLLGGVFFAGIEPFTVGRKGVKNDTENNV